MVKHLTLDLSSGFDLRVVSSSPVLGSTKKRKKEEEVIQVCLRDYKISISETIKDMREEIEWQRKQLSLKKHTNIAHT